MTTSSGEVSTILGLKAAQYTVPAFDILTNKLIDLLVADIFEIETSGARGTNVGAAVGYIVLGDEVGIMVG